MELLRHFQVYGHSWSWDLAPGGERDSQPWSYGASEASLVPRGSSCYRRSPLPSSGWACCLHIFI